MKKTISLFLATILASSMLLTSCVDKVEVNVDSDMLGAMSDILSNIETGNNASIGGNTGETSGTPSTGETQSSTEKQTESETTKETTKETTGETNTNTPEVPEVSPTLNVNGKVTEWNLAEGICETFTTSSVLSNTEFEVNIPVSEAGDYELSFSASLGLTKTFSSGSKKASIALPKTVFAEGEPIMIAYSTSGLDTSKSNSPWLCITKNIGGVDKYICYKTVAKNTSGIINARVDMTGREDNTVLNYVWLPAGEYRVYFIDESYANTRNKNYWLHEDPISISIVPANSGTVVTRSSTVNGNASLSVQNNIFLHGADIVINYVANNISTSSGSKPWLAISKTVSTGTGLFDYYTHWDYTATNEKGTKSFNANNGNSAQTEVASYKSLPEGSYKIYYINGSNLQNALEYTEPIGINIAPAATVKANFGGISLLNTNNPYNVTNVTKTVTVTDVDVDNGYITVNFTFNSLKTNTTYFLNVNNVSLSK